MDLHDYQRRAIDFALRQKSTYMMIDIGLGKTAIALKTAQKLRIPTMVWAPMRVCYMVWPDEIKKWTPNLTYTIMHGDYKNATLKLKRDIYIINYEGIKWFYDKARSGKFPLRKFFFIWDESSMLKDHKSKRWEMMADKMYPIFSKYRMNLSATPATEGLHHLWAQYYLLDMGRRLGQNYYSFFNRNFTEDQYTREVTPKPGAKKKIYERIQDITFRLDSKDYQHFKDPVPVKTPVKLPPAVMQMYAKLEKEFILEYEDKLIDVDTSAMLSNKLQQLVQGALYYAAEEEGKQEAVRRYTVVHYKKAEVLKEVFDTAQGDPILCAIQFRFEYDMICKVFGRKLPIIYGGTPPNQSLQYGKMWNEGKLPILLCHPRSVRYGLNLQRVGHLITWYGLPWSLEDYIQLNGRLARQGQTKLVSINHIIAKDTVDEAIYATLINKNAVQQDLFQAIRVYCMARG